MTTISINGNIGGKTILENPLE